MSKKLSELPLVQQFPTSPTVVISSATDGSKRMDITTFCNLIGIGPIPTIPTALADLTDDSMHRLVTDTEKATWNNKSDFSGDYDDLDNKPTIPTDLSQLSEDPTHRLVTNVQINTWNNKSDFSGDYNDLSNKPTIPASIQYPTIPASGTLGQIIQYTGDSNQEYTKGYFYIYGNGVWDQLDVQPSDGGGSIVTPIDPEDIDTDSTHRFVTDAEKDEWNSKSDFSGSYLDLTDTPYIPAPQVNADWNASSGVAAILNKPDLQVIQYSTMPSVSDLPEGSIIQYVGLESISPSYMTGYFYQNVDGDWLQISVQPEGSACQTYIHWSDLVDLRNNGELVPGMRYSIIDYLCTTTQFDTKSANHRFNIIVTADTENTLNENAYASKWIDPYRAVDYFAGCHLEAWKIKYCIDNDTSRFPWADTVNGKGVIYEMIDEWGNKCPYDFKNIQFKRYKVTAMADANPVVDYTGEYVGIINSSNNVISPRGATLNLNDYIWCYTFTKEDNGEYLDSSLDGTSRNNIIESYDEEVM